MLGNLESKLEAIVADGVATRPHLRVGFAPAGPLGAGQGSIVLALSTFTPETSFAPGLAEILNLDGRPKSRRILPVHFHGTLDFRSRPAADTEVARNDARAQLLEDMSAVAYLLAGPEVQNGAAFATQGADRGFRVLRTGLAGGSAPAALDEAGNYSGRVTVLGDAEIWPVQPPNDEGVIGTIEPVILPLPIALRVQQPRLRPGDSTIISVALGRVRRASGDGGALSPLALAISVLADVPIASRGTVQGAPQGDETGTWITPTADAGDTEITYRAPAGNPGANGRLEYVAVHLATAQGHRGLFLGSTPIQLVPTP